MTKDLSSYFDLRELVKDCMKKASTLRCNKRGDNYIMPYVCDGTTVKVRDGRTGKVICVDRNIKIAVVYTGKAFISTKIENLEVISYKEVK